MFRTLLAKEFLEQRRTSKLWIFLAVFFIVGCISPLLAKYTPDLLRHNRVIVNSHCCGEMAIQLTIGAQACRHHLNGFHQ